MAEAGERALAAATQLEKIGFVEFSTHLVRDVYRVIVEASMDQLKAYADFVSKIAKTLAEYQKEVLGDDNSAEQNQKAYDYIKQVMGFTDSDIGTPPDDTKELSLTDERVTTLKQHFVGITVPTGTPPENKSIDNFITGDPDSKIIKLVDLKAFVIAKLKGSVKNSYDLIKTILKIGMQKVVVTNGEIHTKLTFHVDATDTYSKTSMDYQRNSEHWGISGEISGGYGGSGGTAGGIIGGLVRVMSGAFIGGGISGGYGSSKLKVSVVNEKSTAATNVIVDILGEVKIVFRTETFPSIEA